MFVVGGGNYIEYRNLLEYCYRGQSVKKITYGTSELMNAHQFLQQVSECPAYDNYIIGSTVCLGGHA